MKEKQNPHFNVVLLILVYLMVAMGAAVLTGTSIQMVLISAGILTALLSLKYGYTWDDIRDGILGGTSLAMEGLLILLIIGMVIGAWIASGTIQTIIFYGLEILSPGLFLPTACIIASITSLATGSAWTTGGTVGVALMGIGGGLGIPLPMVAGAIISGAFFGDKLSPLSDSTNVVSAVAEVNLFDHIRYTVYTVTPAYILTVIAYYFLGAKYSGAAINLSEINIILDVLQDKFVLNPLLLLPPILVIIMAVKKIPAIPSLLICCGIGMFFGIFFQGMSLKEVCNIMYGGYVSTTGVPDVDRLLTRGGLSSMYYTVSLALCALSFGGIMEKTNMLNVLLNKIKPFVNTRLKLIVMTIISSYITNLAMASQHMAMIIPGRMFIPAYDNLNLDRVNLSRTLADAGGLSAPLVPWGLSGVFMASALGVPTIEYIPYVFFSFFVPIVAIVIAYTGFKISYTKNVGEVSSETAIY